MARIFCVANQKGGVGKTTTCVNLAAALQQAGQRTLLVDLDPQGNATMGSGIDKRALKHSVYHLLVGLATLDQARVTSPSGKYDVLPANRDLAGAEVELVDITRRENRLRDALKAFTADPGRIGDPFLGRYLVWESSGTSGTPGVFVQDAGALAVYDALETLRRRPETGWRRWFDPMGLGERLAFVGATSGHFASQVTIERLARLDQLCPGDFAAVKRQVDILGETLEPSEFLTQLEAEHRIKPEVRESRRIGFQ